MKKEAVFLSAIIIIAALLRLPLVMQGFFAFTYDQGRDLLAVKEIIVDRNLTLIGPTTGIEGIFYGPWWYYFLLPIFLITSGDPRAMTLVFSIIGIATVLLSFILLRKITNTPIALGASTIIAMSQAFITPSSQMWSPSLVLPIMLSYFFSLIKIFEKPSRTWFIIFGISSGLVLDTGAAFGVILIVATLIIFLFLKKEFYRKETPFFLLGLSLILLPRIIFDFRHDFLISHSALDWLKTPKIFQEKLNIFQRFISRVDIFYLNFAQTFTQSNKALSLLPTGIIIASVVISKLKIFRSILFKFLSLIILFMLLGFTALPDVVWEYYLVGLPLIYILIFSLSLKYLFEKKKEVALLILVATIIVGFNKKMLSPFSLTWEGDGAVYRNQKMVMDFLKGDLKGDYSLYFYTPARFDYPFYYLTSWYLSNNLIDPPQERQKKMFLIIRDDNDHLYLPTGWYGDKTQNNTIILERKTFPGNIIVEKHITND